MTKGKSKPKEKEKYVEIKKASKNQKVPEIKKLSKGKRTPEIKGVFGSEKAPQSVRWELKHAVAFWGLAILLFLPPYFRGLFFQPEQERALIFATIIFWVAWLWKWSKRDHDFLSHPLDYFVLAFPAVYLLSAFQAVNYGLAVAEVVKTTLYFLVFWLASRLVRSEKDIVTLLHVIYISAIGVALAGLATATGVIHIHDGFLNGRIYSTFQYPNALASYLVAVIFIGLYLWRRAGLLELGGVSGGVTGKGIPAWLSWNNINQYLYAAGNFLLFAVLLGTKSQGGLLVFSLVFLLFLIGLPKGNRIPVIFHFVFVCILSFVSIWQFLSTVAGGNVDLAWLWIFIGLALALAFQMLYRFGENRGMFQWIAAHRNIILAVVVLVAVSAGIGGGVYISGYGDTVKTLVEEIKVRNATERMYFFQDAMKMFKERPVLGWGGGGWQEAYRAYQGYLYNSNQVHGHYFQIMVEAGIFGLLAILGIWMSFLYIAHRLYHGAKEDNATRFLVWTITIAAISIGLHAVIDFDLSLSALALVLWTMFGFARGIGIYCAAGTEEKKSRTYIPPNNTVLVGVSIASFIIVMFAGSLAAAGNYAVQSGKYIQKQNFNRGIELLQKATAYNPFNADYHSNLARIYQAVGKFDEGIAEARKAIELSKYSAPRYADLAVLYYTGKKNSEEAIEAAEKALSLAPLQIQWYELLAMSYFSVGYEDLVSGNREAAKHYFEKTTDIPGRIKAKTDNLNDTEKKLWNVEPLLTATPVVKFNVGASQYFLGRWSEADENLQAALNNEKVKGEALLLLAVLRDKQGRAQEAQECLAQAQKLGPEFANRYDFLRQLHVLQ